MESLTPTSKRTPLPLQQGYIDWSPVKAAVELIQNYLDERDKGHDGEIKHTRGDKLIIRNQGTTLGSEHVPLGATTKRGEDASRGQFGEGMKLAFLSLLNHDRTVKVRSGSERWFPKMAPFDGYGDEPILYLDRRSINHVNHVEVTIAPFTGEEYDKLVSRVLALRDDVEAHHARRGSLLTDESSRGKLFVKGLYICRLSEVTGNRQDVFEYGYNLKKIELDRDRRMADPWSVKREIRDLVVDLVDAEAIETRDIYNIMMSGKGEASILASEFAYSLADRLASHFRDKHGDNAVPVTSVSEALQAGHFGRTSVEVSPEVHRTITAELDSMEDVQEKMSEDIKHTYNLDELYDAEVDNLRMIHDLMELNDVHVVDFYDPNRNGLYSDGSIHLARDILADKQQLIATTVHEATHQEGGDGTREHRDAMQYKFADIILRLMEEQ